MAIHTIIESILFLAIIGIIILIVIYWAGSPNVLFQDLSNSIRINTSIPNRIQNISYPSTTIRQNYIPYNAAISYALSLINNDRAKFGLPPVSYSNESSAQQHANSMQYYDYFSHWDIYGLKPYMRYALLADNQSNQSVDENIAFISNSSGINVTNALYDMEYSFVYNDSAEQNGHRDNILNPQHNEVSIGIAYNATKIYFVEDFINDYVSWFYGTPSFNDGVVQLKGRASGSYVLSEVLVTYDPTPVDMSTNQLNRTKAYSYGSTIAGIGYKKGTEIYSYQNLTTINATNYIVQGGSFSVSFDMSSLIANHGAGVYTVMLLLSNTNSTYLASIPNLLNLLNESNPAPYEQFPVTYTIFINASGKRYKPNKI